MTYCDLAISHVRVADAMTSTSQAGHGEDYLNTDQNRKKIKESELVLRHASRKITDLTINIKLVINVCIKKHHCCCC